MADKKEIAQIVGVISAAYPNFSPTPQTVEVYYQCLNDLPVDELKAATLQCISELGRKFAPSVGELRGAVAEIRKSSMNTPSAYEAWQEVLQQMSAVGSYGIPEFSSPLIQRVVRSLGWRNLCLSENQTADRARFLQAYEQVLERATHENMLLPEVRNYIEARGGVLLDSGAQIKQLAEGMKHE